MKKINKQTINGLSKSKTFPMGLLLCLASIFFIVFLGGDLIKGLKSLTWPKTKGTISHSGKSQDRGGKFASIRYKLEIKYRYQVNNVNYAGTYGGVFDDKFTSSETTAKDILKKYYVGKPTEVYYNPDQPKESCLSRGPSFWFVASFLLVIFIGVLGSFTVYCALEDEDEFWEKYKKANKTTAPTAGEESSGLTNDLETGVLKSRGGFNTDFWSFDQMQGKWAKFEEKGPEYAIPEKRYCGASKIPNCPGTLYVALYPKDKFENFIHFCIYDYYTSSIQQTLFQTGSVDMEWFVPQEGKEVISDFQDWCGQIMDFSQKPDIKKCLKSVTLPSDINWVHRLHYDAWFFSLNDGTFEVRASTDKGYLIMYAIDE